MTDFKLTRGSDWGPDLHLAADNYEAAVRVTTGATDEGQLTAALALLDATKLRLGALLLIRDKERRPHIYAAEPPTTVEPAPGPWRRDGLDILGVDGSRVCVLLEGDPNEHRDNPNLKRKIDAEGRLITAAPTMRDEIKAEAAWLQRMTTFLREKGLHFTAGECQSRADSLQAMIASLESGS